MFRSEQEKAAYQRLTEAVTEIIKLAKDDGEDDGYLTKFVVAGMTQGMNSDGETWSINFSLAKDNSVPLSDQLGLLTHALVKAKQRVGVNEG